MSEENKEFNERFETVEQALKYIADSQAKSEWLHKEDQIRRRKFEEESNTRWAKIEKHLAHITQLTGIAFEDLTFQDEKISAAGEILAKANPKRS